MNVHTSARRASCARPPFAVLFALAIAATPAPANAQSSFTAPDPARGGVRLFRPLIADPRENQAHWRMASYTEDWRYGTDVTDSTSQGGVVQDRKGFLWEVAAGETFRWIPLERIGKWRGPWVRYQLGVPAGVFSRFDGTGILLNTDYQYGLSLDVLWRGEFDRERGITRYRHSVVTSRLTVMHHSSHLGDEYIAQGTFGRNQVTPPYQGAELGYPPVKRMDLAYEDIALTLSFERSGADERATLRAYAGGESKLAFPRRWGVGAIEPQNFRSATARAGLEYRGAAESDAPADALPSLLLNKLLRAPVFDSEWYGAFDVRLAKPYNFASADNRAGETEKWTPRLWTAAPYGREFRNYAGSWHAMVGAILHHRVVRVGAPAARPVGAEWLISLEWYRGYTPDGQLLDQRLAYRPREYWVPSVTAHF